MAKQTFTTGQVLTAAQMTSLQQTAMGGGSPSTKTASYVLVAADAGTVIQMNSASATTITVNTALFSAGDSVQIQNIGAGTCTITAGTATVNSAGSLSVTQYDGGFLYFSSASSALWFDYTQAGSSGKLLQVVYASYATETTISSATFSDTGLSATITPSSASSKVLIFANTGCYSSKSASNTGGTATRILRGSTEVYSADGTYLQQQFMSVPSGSGVALAGVICDQYLDSPSTTSSTTYKVQGASGGTGTFQRLGFKSNMVLMEIGA